MKHNPKKLSDFLEKKGEELQQLKASIDLETLTEDEREKITEIEETLRLGAELVEAYPEALAAPTDDELDAAYSLPASENAYLDPFFDDEDFFLAMIDKPPSFSSWPVSDIDSLRSISLGALKRLRPREYPLGTYTIDAIIAETLKGNVMLHTADVPGGLGGGEILLAVIVPIVAAVVDDVLQRLGAATWNAALALVRQDQKLESELKVSGKDIEIIIRRYGSSAKGPELRDLAKAINAALNDELKSE